jgi:hypothetical protein
VLEYQTIMPLIFQEKEMGVEVKTEKMDESFTGIML